MRSRNGAGQWAWIARWGGVIKQQWHGGGQFSSLCARICMYRTKPRSDVQILTLERTTKFNEVFHKSTVARVTSVDEVFLLCTRARELYIYKVMRLTCPFFRYTVSNVKTRTCSSVPSRPVDGEFKRIRIAAARLLHRIWRAQQQIQMAAAGRERLTISHVSGNGTELLCEFV